MGDFILVIPLRSRGCLEGPVLHTVRLEAKMGDRINSGLLRRNEIRVSYGIPINFFVLY